MLNAAGDPITLRSQTALNSARPGGAAHLRHELQDAWVTIHDTAVDGNAPFDANPLAKAARTARRSSGRRTASSGRGSGSRSSTSTRPATPTRPAPRTRPRRLAARSSSYARRTRRPTPARSALFYKGDEAHAGFDNVTFISRDQITFVEDAGDTLHGQRNALDSGFVLNVDDELREPEQPAGPLARRGPRRLGDARRRQRRLRQERGRQRDHRRRSSPTATRHRTASSAPSRRSRSRPAGAGSTPSSTATTPPTR